MSLLCRLLAPDSADQQPHAGMANQQSNQKPRLNTTGKANKQSQQTHSHRSVFPRYLHNTETPGTAPQALSRLGLHYKKGPSLRKCEIVVSYRAFDA